MHEALNIIYCRTHLRFVFKDVKARIPAARARDMSACCSVGGFNKQWLCELTKRACYGERYYWEGTADNAFHAKALAWEKFLAKRFPEPD